MRSRTRKFSQPWLAMDRLAPFLRESSMRSEANRSSLNAQRSGTPEHRFRAQKPKLQARRAHAASRAFEIRAGREDAGFCARTLRGLLVSQTALPCRAKSRHGGKITCDALASSAPAVDTTAATTLRSCSTPHEVSSSCHCLHLRHCHARHAGAWLDRAGLAEIDPRLPRRQHEFGSMVEWCFRHSVCGDAIFLLTSARCVIGQIWPATGNLALKSWPRPGLHRDGGFADNRVAVSGPDHFRNHSVEHSDGD